MLLLIIGVVGAVFSSKKVTINLHKPRFIYIIHHVNQVNDLYLSSSDMYEEFT